MHASTQNLLLNISMCTALWANSVRSIRILLFIIHKTVLVVIMHIFLHNIVSKHGKELLKEQILGFDEDLLKGLWGNSCAKSLQFGV